MKPPLLLQFLAFILPLIGFTIITISVLYYPPTESIEKNKVIILVCCSLWLIASIAIVMNFEKSQTP
jgi:positive regulator of sigma E activity